MTGKFNDKYNTKGYTVMMVTFLVGFTLMVFILITLLNKTGIDSKYAILGVTVPCALAISAAVCAESALLSKGSFTADENNVEFKVGLEKRIIGYNEIMSAEVRTGIIHSRYGSFPQVELILTLKNGKKAVFCDGSFSEEELSTPERHKKFLDYHPFTFLCDYINQQVGEHDR